VTDMVAEFNNHGPDCHTFLQTYPEEREREREKKCFLLFSGIIFTK